jgi:hypothetical protein
MEIIIEKITLLKNNNDIIKTIIEKIVDKINNKVVRRSASASI